jgi:hypothetical protein
MLRFFALLILRYFAEWVMEKIRPTTRIGFSCYIRANQGDWTKIDQEIAHRNPWQEDLRATYPINVRLDSDGEIYVQDVLVDQQKRKDYEQRGCAVDASKNTDPVLIKIGE